VVEPPKGTTEENEPETFSREYVQELRRESAKYRTDAKTAADKIKTAEDTLTEIQRSQMTEDEKQKARLEELEKTVVPEKDNTIRTLRVQIAAGKLGIVDPEAATLLMDWKKVDAGEKVDDLLTAMIEARPWLKGPDPVVQSGTNTVKVPGTTITTNPDGTRTTTVTPASVTSPAVPPERCRRRGHASWSPRAWG